MDDLQLFVSTLARGLKDDERLNAAAFLGDPEGSARFKPFGVYKRGDLWVVPGNAEFNRYITVGAFKQNADGEWRRQKALFAAACAMMIDDIGDDDGAGVKLPKSVVGGLKPTFIVETSRGNYQYWYAFDEPFRDAARFERLVDGFIEARCGNKDSGFRDATRIGRVPQSTNGKRSKGNWPVRLVEANVDARYPVVDLADFWGVDMTPRYRRSHATDFVDAEARIYNFELVMMYMNMMGLVKRGKTGLTRTGRIDYSDYNRAGWMDVTCPWVGEHTAAADNGAGVQAPLEGNGMLGGFQCHHSTCKEDRDLKTLLKFINEQFSEEHIAEIAKLLDDNNRSYQ